MNASRPRGRPSDSHSGTWASESIPLSVRKELLERELNKLGLRKVQAHGAADSGTAGPAGEPGASHPKADVSDASRHGD